jgi:hypothetical protein
VGGRVGGTVDSQASGSSFQKKISEDLFVEETHHAEQWERKLRIEKNIPHFLTLDFGNHFWNRSL